MYVTEYAERQFCQIAVNARYICYGLRAGQVRVLHKDTASRALLRGHTAQIADMRFSPATNADILASFGVDGNLFVKKIGSPAGGDGDIEEKALAVTVTTDVAAPGVALTFRVRWPRKPGSSRATATACSRWTSPRRRAPRISWRSTSPPAPTRRRASP